MAQTSDPSENQQQVPISETKSWPISEPPPDHRPEVRTDPSLDEHQRAGFTGATWTALILGALVLIMLLIFILQNNDPADFAYLGWAFTLPLGIAMLFAAIAGMLIMGLFGSVRLFKLGRRVRKLEKEREQLKRTLE